MSNSSLATYTKLSPNYWAARRPITRITPHCVVGQCTIETLGNVFATRTRQASSNYGIAKDGRIGMFVPEDKSSWCSSSYDNDTQAVTIEVASDTVAPYRMNEAAYEALVKLCVDICRRNGKKRLLWFANKNTALSYRLASDEMLLTVHRWYSAKACPGDWLMQRLPDLAKRVTAQLSRSTSKPETNTQPVTQPTAGVKAVKASGVARKFSKSLAGSYTTTDDLNMRDDAGTKHSILVTIPKGTKVQCYGYYSTSGMYKWPYVVAQVGGVWYTGFVSKAYLK